MGIHDRDYMRTDRSSPFGRPRSSPLWTVLGALCGILAIAYFAMQGHERRTGEPDARHPTLTAPVVAPRAEARPDPFKGDPTWHAGPRPAIEDPTGPTQGSTRVVYKCVVNGRVTYSGPNDCRGGTASSLEIAAGPDSVAVAAARIAAQREVASPAEPEAAQRRQRAADDAAAPVAAMQERQQADARRTECALLDQQIRDLDSQARQPSSGQVQDWIRSQRADARTRQFRLHC